jgi:antitoxin component YwqK of YwqJK toxin-antitoxin module
VLWLTACEGPGTVHVVRHPSGKVKEMWHERGEPGRPSVREGRYESWYPDGARESELYYAAGRKHGPARGWDQAGHPVFAGEYREDFLVREVRKDAEGNPVVDRSYAVRGAAVMALGPSGDSLEVYEACAFLEDASGSSRHGLCRMTYPGGAVLSDRRYRHGRLHGPVKAWHPDGAPWMAGAYERGAPAGPWKIFSADGKPLWSAAFSKGEPTGTWQEWFPDGKPKARSAYRGGRPEGPYQEWYRNGRLRLSGGRKEGKRDGVETAWYPDGGRLYEAKYRNGRLEGEFRQWFPGGGMRLQCRFHAGRKHGPSRAWHRQGGLMELSMYQAGVLNGAYKAFAPDGKVVASREYRAGDLATDARAKELLDLLGAGNVKVPVGAFGLYWGMTPAECRGALSVLPASDLRQEGEVLSARAVLFAQDTKGGPRPAHLNLRFNTQGELWQIRAELAPGNGDEFFPLCERVEAEMRAELGQVVMRKAEGGTGFRMTRKREWGRFSVTQGAEAPIRRDLPVVTAEGDAPGAGAGFRFTLANHLFREYVDPANASVTPPEWPEETFLAGR